MNSPKDSANPEDTARFLIRSHRAGVIEIAWSLERDHYPVAVGALRLTEAGRASDCEGAHATLEFAAREYIAAYLRHTGRDWQWKEDL